MACGTSVLWEPRWLRVCIVSRLIWELLEIETSVRRSNVHVNAGPESALISHVSPYRLPGIASENRFPQLFPPLKQEVVAQRTVDAVKTNTAFVYLPWTMHMLVILKRY